MSQLSGMKIIELKSSFLYERIIAQENCVAEFLQHVPLHLTMVDLREAKYVLRDSTVVEHGRNYPAAQIRPIYTSPVTVLRISEADAN